jgi:hypothetical protein
MSKLGGMVREYLADVQPGGVDADFADGLLNRRAPWRDWLLFYACQGIKWPRRHAFGLARGAAKKAQTGHPETFKG